MFSNPTAVTFIGYLIVMVGVGVFAYYYTRSYTDFILGGRSLGGFVTALSVGASDMSGWLLMGLPGAVFLFGVSQSWIAIGLILGSWLNWRFAAARLRVYTEKAHNSLTLPDYLTHRFEDKSNALRIIASAIEDANRFIRGVETGPLYNEENTAVMQMLGEAKCLRAMVYHDLVVMFGDVPFTFLPASQLGDNYVIPVMNREEIQNKLIED